MGEKQGPIFTKRGDQGYTSDIISNRVPKDSPLIRLFGKIDSLQSAVDFAILHSGEEREILNYIQEKLWQSYPAIQSSNKNVKSPISALDLRKLESYILESLENVPKYFVRFHNIESVALNECRVRCREVESYLTPFLRKKKVEPVFYAYFNRLSSFFYALSLKKEQESGNK